MTKGFHSSLRSTGRVLGVISVICGCLFAQTQEPAGLAEFKKGDYENAVAYESRAVESDPYFAQLHLALERFKAAQAKAHGNK